MNTMSLKNDVESLAKIKYGEHYLTALWGSAQALLTDEQLEIMSRVMEIN
jgi:hypothetical protein